MKRVLAFVFAILTAFQAEAVPENPDFKEVYDLLRTHLTGVDEKEINRAAVQGLINELGPKVSLMGEDTRVGSTNGSPEVSATVYEQSYAYVRIRKLNRGADKKVLEAYTNLTATNKVKGLVLDLRYANGNDYAAATAMADWFFAGEQPLVDYGDGVKKSTVKTNAIRLPTAVLVNGKTAGAAEAFAGILRQAQVGLVIGGPTSGQASISREFTLKTGQKLRIATTPIKLGDGTLFPPNGLKPDIQVDVPEELERMYFEDAYKQIQRTNQVASATSLRDGGTGTNRPPRRRMNEAELVRMSREGLNSDPEPARRERDEPSAPSVNDPALARALDILKGLAVVQQSKS